MFGRNDRLEFCGEYPSNWHEVSLLLRKALGWRCERCGRGPAPGHVLTVHHSNGNKSDCRIDNLEILCQKCHLEKQADPFKPYQLSFFDVTALFLPERPWTTGSPSQR